MKIPFVKVNIDSDPDKDLTPYLEFFTFEESIEKDNLTELTFKEEHSLKLADNPDLQAGKILSIQFGYMGEELSDIHLVKITDIQTQYAASVKLKVFATDSGMAMKKVASSKIWKKKTASDIVREIAGRYKMDVTITNTSKIYKSMPQGNRSDFGFMKYLASIQPNGNFIFYTSGNKAFFIDRGLNYDSAVTLKYGEPGSGIVSFMPVLKEVEVPGGANETLAIGVDLAKKRVNAVQSNPETVADEVGLGDKMMRLFNTSGDFEGLFDLSKKRPTTVSDNKSEWKVAGTKDNRLPESTGKTLISPTGDMLELGSLANGLKKRATMMIIEAVLTQQGNPNLKANDIITVGGYVANVHTGNYKVVSVRHNIGGRAYTNSIVMRKNAIKQVGPLASKIKKNVKPGPDEINKGAEVPKYRIFDGKADQIGTATQGNKRPD